MSASACTLFSFVACTLLSFAAAAAVAAVSGRGPSDIGACGPGERTDHLPPTCNSKIYCQGELLNVIQNAHLYKDSKKFVDMSLIHSPEDTLKRFDKLMKETDGSPSKEQIQKFVDDNFEDEDKLQMADIPDWVPKPSILNRIADPKLKQWASELNNLWKNFTRKVSKDVKENSNKYSLIYIPHHFIIPGGRFREFYYWDTYWVVRGLLLSDMKVTAKGIIENFFYILDNYGIIPCGGRIYYLQRSQPPLLTPMVYNYFKATKDVKFVENNIHFLEKELDFWMNNRTVGIRKNGKKYTLARYYAPSTGPRPESYREDFDNGKKLCSDQRREELYIDLKSAAESGWDFSGRWIIKDGTNKGDITDTHTKYIIPVDLNAFIYGNLNLLSKLHSILGNADKSIRYSLKAREWKKAVTSVLWNEKLGSWFDYDILNNKSRNYFYPSNITPLWTKCYNENRTSIIARKIVKYLKGTKILQHFSGGIPTSLNNTGEQWDLPNAWPPLQSIVIQGLQFTNESSAKKLAYEFAERWVRSNYKGFVMHDVMFEKYNAEFPGTSGGGGEYLTQTGFGWTNGVIFELLDTYGKRLRTK